ncbi:hypothetical protein K4O88_03835 [Staphylococcus epidermidis]|nr:hypothetical protein [Staphylococcus epidermidis]MCG1774104.1 hypothetical protein [Staphylococcus epidermidis]MCG1778578.1 hypothetical protein [Staphylococcus epidermidis]
MDKNEFELKFRAIENEVDNEIDSSDFQDKLTNHIEENYSNYSEETKDVFYHLINSQYRSELLLKESLKTFLSVDTD